MAATAVWATKTTCRRIFSTRYEYVLLFVLNNMMKIVRIRQHVYVGIRRISTYGYTLNNRQYIPIVDY